MECQESGNIFLNVKIVIKPFVNSESQEAELKETPEAISPTVTTVHFTSSTLDTLPPDPGPPGVGDLSDYKVFFKLDGMVTLISLSQLSCPG